MNLIVRPMVAADLSEVLDIEREAFTDPWTEGMYRAELARIEDRRWFVAQLGEAVVGFAGLWLAEDATGLGIAHLLDLAVRADLRRRGIARTLVSAAMEETVALGTEIVTLEVRPSNEAAMDLYAEAGFTPSGQRRGYYSDTGEDALIMQTPRLREGRGARLREALARRGAADAARLSAEMSGGELILALETSCDETAAAVMRDGRELLSSIVASQVDFHARFGGVVPEIASRKHTEAVVAVVDEALEAASVRFADLTAMAVTHGPGLIGALVVGLAYAKGVSLATGLPLVGVNHLESHIFAALLSDPDSAPPLVALVVSGGHTSLIHMPAWGEYRTLGATLDDATGEAFDKVAKVLGLGYPGGPVLSRLAESGDAAAIAFPRAMMDSGTFDFSLSGLKTAVINHIRHETDAGRTIDVPDLAASFQQAIVDVQVAKSVAAVEETGVGTFVIGGGVASNRVLRESLGRALEERGVRVAAPPHELCTDNAAMVAAAAHFRLSRGDVLRLDAEAVADLSLDT